MKILFATGRPFLPDRVGGAESALHAMIESLVQAGHACELCCGIGARGWRRAELSLRFALTGGRIDERFDRRLRYPVRRGRSRGDHLTRRVARRLRAWAPDLVVTQLDRAGDIAREARRAGQPVIIIVHDIWFDGLRLDHLAADPAVCFVAVSAFVAGRLHDRFGIDAVVIHPQVDHTRMVARSRSPRWITHVNPKSCKGIHVTLDVAEALPEREFLLVDCWTLKPQERRTLEARIARMPQVRHIASTRDMQRVYAETALLLVPSQCDEGFPMVIREAHGCGIPVVASRVGGIPELLHAGGKLLDREAPIADWVAAVEGLLADPQVYQLASDSARDNAGAPHLARLTVPAIRGAGT